MKQTHIKKIHFRSMNFQSIIINILILNYIRFVKNFQKMYYVNMQYKIIKTVKIKTNYILVYFVIIELYIEIHFKILNIYIII